MKLGHAKWWNIHAAASPAWVFFSCAQLRIYLRLAVLTSLVVSASGLQLGQSSISTAKLGGVVSGAGNRDVPGLPQAALAAPILPAAAQTAGAAAAGAFTAAEEQQAQQFLQSLRACTSSEQELGKFRRAWAGAPLLRQYGSQGLGTGFSPLPVASLAPRMKVSGGGGAFEWGQACCGASRQLLMRIFLRLLLSSF